MEALAAGQVVAGQFEVQSLLGSGGMAEVFVARDRTKPESAPPVVLKRIFPALAKRQDFVRMFGDEARIALRLQHPNICRVFDVVVHDEIPVLVMEYIQGVSFLDWVVATREDPVRLDLVVEALRQVCDGLAYAHGLREDDGTPLGIVHRDISPQNLLVNIDGVVKIIDFGVANAAIKTDRTQAGVLKGKYPYMAPERVTGTGEDNRSDIFSLGVVAFEMTTRKRLFWRDSDYQTLHAIVSGQVPSLRRVAPGTPTEWDQVVRHALARRPSDRYGTAGEMGHALTRAAAAVGLQPNRGALASLVRSLTFGATGRDHGAVPTEPSMDAVSKASAIPFVGDLREGEWSPAIDQDDEPTLDATPQPFVEGAPGRTGTEIGLPPPRVLAATSPEPRGEPAPAEGQPLPDRQDHLQAWQQRAQDEAGARGGKVSPRDAAAAAGYRLPELPPLPVLGLPPESIPGCFSYALDVVRLGRAGKAALAVLAAEEANLERERGELFAKLGERLRFMAGEIDGRLANQLAQATGPPTAASSGGEPRAPADPETDRLRHELAEIEARLPELDAAVARAPSGEPRAAALAMSYLAKQRVAHLRGALGEAGAAEPQRPRSDERAAKLLADLGRVAWKSGVGREHAPDLFRALERCRVGVEVCRAEARSLESVVGEFERRPVAVAILTVAIPAVSIAALLVLLAMSGWLG